MCVKRTRQIFIFKRETACGVLYGLVGSAQGTGDGSSPAENFLSDRKAISWLLLVADKGEIGIVKVFSMLGFTIGMKRNDCSEHFGIGESGHCSVRSTLQLLWKVQASISG